MWSFEGEFKSRPKQSLSGKSRALDRQTFLNKLKDERNQREDDRRRKKAAILIQAWMRGCLCRCNLLREQRKVADETLLLVAHNGLEKDSAEKIISLFIKIFDVKLDSDRVLTICQHLVRNHSDLRQWLCSSFEKWKFLLPRLVGFALQTLSYPTNSKNGNDKPVSHATPLRLLEIVLSPSILDHQIPIQERQMFHFLLMLHLLNSGYYHHLVNVLIKRVPEVYEPTCQPPVPLCESLMKLIIQPIILYDSTDDQTLNNMLFSELTKEVLMAGHHSQVCNYILPCLSTSLKLKKNLVEDLVLYVFNNLQNILAQKKSASLLFSFLAFTSHYKDFSDASTCSQFLHTIGALLACYSTSFHKCIANKEDSDNDSDSDESEISPAPLTPQIEQICEKNLEILNGPEFVTWILRSVENYILHDDVVINFSILFHHILSSLKYQLHVCKMLYSVVSHRHIILRPMWRVLTAMHQGSASSLRLSNQHSLPNPYGMPLLQVLSYGYPLTPTEKELLIPLLSTFSATLIAVLSTLHDSEFLGENDELKTGKSNNFNPFPFTVEEVIKMSALLRDVCVGLTELAHPDMRTATYIDGTHKVVWANCLKVCVGVVRHIHLRDTRRRFCPDNHWLSSKVFLPQKEESAHSCIIQPRGRRRNRRLFQSPRFVTKDELELEGPSLSIADQRRMTLLQEIPFVFPFEARMGLFSNLISKERKEHQATASYAIGPSINVSIRRTHIYEDAFEKLSPQNESNIRLKMRVRLMNVTGLDEAGIDGGGIFREFLNELLKTAFDPTRGFFLLTRDNTLYPNPGAHLIAENYEAHFFFIGRMVGKALFENLLVEIPLAGFFLSKLLCGSSSVEFHYLDSLDPELCHHLLSLKSYSGDISELGLDFTVLNSHLGQNTVEELLPNGANTAVTNQNVIEYIYRMADYKLNRQIARNCQAFKEGVFDVIDARWLRLFNWRELQMLISGASTPINLEDFKENTKYSGVYNEHHPTILAFWQAVSRFDENQRRQLLKFVTSCSRPPLMGFKELFPAFCIHPSGTEDRLPSASTCMNLLKLPEYKDYETLKEKLLYAITSSAGFELS